MEAAKQDAREHYVELKAAGVTSSRDAMLKRIQQNQPRFVEAPSIPAFAPYFDDVLQKYVDMVKSIGGRAYLVNSYDEIIVQLKEDFAGAKRIVSFQDAFAAVADILKHSSDPHTYEDVDVCIMTSPLAVAENSAVWVSNKEMPERVLPFITQSLVVVVNKNNIVPTMHDAYNIIADKDYGFATFIAGPSKTADIEQSLVLGAHGPKTMTVFVLNE
jgi:L-lactate dehydrogenase complex protein LldG